MGRRDVSELDIEAEIQAEKEHKADVQKDLDAFASEYASGNEKEVTEARKRFLEKEIEGVQIYISHLKQKAEKCHGEVWQYIEDMYNEIDIPEQVKKLKKYERELRLLTNPGPSEDDGIISEADIEMAKQKDCADFVDIKRDGGLIQWALCVFHTDSAPSMACHTSP